MAVVKANYLRRGTTAQQRAKVMKAVRQAAKYYTYREGPDRAQRVWQTHDGRTLSYQDVHAEIRAAAQTYGYTYRIVLSTKDVDINKEGYRAVLADRFAAYYFVEHHNTDYPHAHVIGFCHQRIRKAELQAMRSNVQELERAWVQGQQQQPGQVPEPVQFPGRDQHGCARVFDHGLG